MKRRLLIFLLMLFGLAVSGAAFAHFKLNFNVRVFHVVHGENSLDLYLRSPMAYLVADKVGKENSTGLPEPAPFTYNRLEDGVLMHFVDVEALRRNPAGLGGIASDSLKLETSGGALEAEVVAVRVFPIGSEPGFATKEEAEDALSKGPVFPLTKGETYVGDATVDVLLQYPAVPENSSYKLSSLAAPGLSGQEDTANLLLDYRGEKTRTYRVTGLLLDPIEVSGSGIAAASTFVIAGIHHILEGLDHVLFVLCMVLGAQTLGALLARVTGFTIGHTVTLILGFFGLAPSGPWFIPAVETAIALSIIYAAADAVFQKPGKPRSNTSAVCITSTIGLLHGFGFSFMLREILRVDADNVWQSLLAFNVGVELGQVAIVALVWPVVVLIRRMSGRVWIATRGLVAVCVSLAAVFWVVERAGSLFA